MQVGLQKNRVEVETILLEVMSNEVTIRLCLVGCKIFSGKENIFMIGKYFQVFGCIPKNILENIFWCLVIFLKML